MKFSYNWLKDYIKSKLPKPEKLADLLTRHSFELEDVYPVKSAGGGAKQFNGVKKVSQDWVLDIDVLPNRAGDCFSHLGIARECAALLNTKYQIPDTKLIEDKNSKIKDFVSVEVKNKMACSRYAVSVVTDVKVGPSPKWIQERLKLCGLRPINNIVDIANYVMLETGQPLHAFDFEKISGADLKVKSQKSKVIKKIIIRKAKRGEKITTLDEQRYDLDEDILVVADAEKPIAIAGIKGGKSPEIDEKTKVVILESANFSSEVIRKSSRKLKLKTDASIRFEHGIDSNLIEIAINRATYLIQKIAGGKIVQGLIDFYPKKVLPKRIKLDLNYLERLLGVKIPEKEIIRILKSLGLKIVNCELKILNVEVPTFRIDISLPENLIEEIGRIYGYEKIPAQFPVATLVPPKRNLDIFWEDMTKDILKEAGFNEIYNYSFISEKDVKIFGNKKLIEIENPISSDFQYLRSSLILNLLKNVQKNQAYFKEIKIFELGKVFYRKQGIKNKEQFEKKMLTGLMTGDMFYQAKGVIDSLLNKLGISNLWYDEYQPTPEESQISIWHPTRCAEIKINQEEIGFLGEISASISENLKIENKVVVFDIDFEKLIKLASEEHEYRPLSKHPAAIRDLAILVPSEIRVEEVLNKIETAGGDLLRDVDLFDIYEGEEIQGGKKNFAFHLIYQAEDRVLTSEEIDQMQQKIIKTLEKEEDWQVRR